MDALTANIPRFIAFRVLFNARFYYPVLGVLFVDLGLTVAQYAILNVVWAATILAFEVPSGALADVIGRRRMVILAAALMVAEMLVFSFAPPGAWLFPLLVLNRVLSGAAEASASGADEALAYESLPETGRTEAWTGVLARLMRWQSGAFVAAMLMGVACYDSAFLARAAEWIGVSWHPAETTRWPLYLTLATAVPCLFVALGLRESRTSTGKFRPALGAAARNIRAGARWIVRNRRVLLVILAGLVVDSFVRLFMTFGSNYYRLIGIPEWAYGPLGAALGFMGFLAAPLARRMVRRFSVRLNFSVLWALSLAGLVGAACVIPGLGVAALIPLSLAMAMLSFFLSSYLNDWTPSKVRATVLSFRGVIFNLGYAGVGLAFAALSAGLDGNSCDADGILRAALAWLPPGFAAGLLILGGFVRLTRRRDDRR